MGREEGGKGTNLIVSLLFLPPFWGRHTEFSRQGQRPKPVEAVLLSYVHFMSSAHWHFDHFQCIKLIVGKLFSLCRVIIRVVVGTWTIKAPLSNPRTIYVWMCRTGWVILAAENKEEKLVPVPLHPTQIPHVLTGARTRTSAVRSRRLTAWAMVRPALRLPVFAASISRGLVIVGKYTSDTESVEFHVAWSSLPLILRIRLCSQVRSCLCLQLKEILFQLQLGYRSESCKLLYDLYWHRLPVVSLQNTLLLMHIPSKGILTASKCSSSYIYLQSPRQQL
jgi:hypothetical protein